MPEALDGTTLDVIVRGLKIQKQFYLDYDDWPGLGTVLSDVPVKGATLDVLKRTLEIQREFYQHYSDWVLLDTVLSALVRGQP